MSESPQATTQGHYNGPREYLEYGWSKAQTLPLKRKTELIDAVEKCPAGKKKKEVAEEFSIVSNALSIILRNEEKYRKAFYGGQEQTEIASFNTQ